MKMFTRWRSTLAGLVRFYWEPRFEITSECFFLDPDGKYYVTSPRIFTVGERVLWRGCPNHAMRALNFAARVNAWRWHRSLPKPLTGIETEIAAARLPKLAEHELLPVIDSGIQPRRIPQPLKGGWYDSADVVSLNIPKPKN